MAPNGRWFFIDHNERTTSWVDPRTGRASPMPNQKTVPVASRKVDDDLGPLPEGWEERVHTDGRIFFIDHSEFTFIFKPRTAVYVNDFKKYKCVYFISTADSEYFI